MTEQGNNEQVQEQATEVEMESYAGETPRAIHHRTKRGADLAIAKQQISQESHAAVLAGRITLAEAKELGRSAGPDGPVGQVTKKASKTTREPTLTPCLCGICGEMAAKTFRPGHDMRMVSLAKAYVRGEATPNDEQMQYIESSGKLDRARAQVAKDEAKRAEREAKKAEAQKAKQK